MCSGKPAAATATATAPMARPPRALLRVLAAHPRLLPLGMTVRIAWVPTGMAREAMTAVMTTVNPTATKSPATGTQRQSPHQGTHRNTSPALYPRPSPLPRSTLVGVSQGTPKALQQVESAVALDILAVAADSPRSPRITPTGGTPAPVALQLIMRPIRSSTAQGPSLLPRSLPWTLPLRLLAHGLGTSRGTLDRM